jgi:hypothetical protein
MVTNDELGKHERIFERWATPPSPQNLGGKTDEINGYKIIIRVALI